MRIVIIDIIRGMAITLLLIAHIAQKIQSPLGQFFGIQNIYYVTVGGFAVTIFLILSGLSLELKYGSKDFRYINFIFKRCLRIYPIYYISLAGGIILYAILIYNHTGSLHQFWSKLGFFNVFFSLTGFYAFSGQWGGPFVATSWFIGLITSLYLLFPFISEGIKNRPHILIISFFLISFLSRQILGGSNIIQNRPLDWFPLCRIFEFSLGVYLARFLRSKIIKSTNKLLPYSSFFKTISDLSFPLFLIHYPLGFLITYLPSYGINQFFSIIVYLFISVLFSWIALKIDIRIPRNIILKKFSA